MVRRAFASKRDQARALRASMTKGQTVLDALHIAIDFMTLPVRPDVFTIPAFEIGSNILGPFSLRWYSLSYIAGILFAWWLLTRMTLRPASPMTAEHVDGFITWATLGVILGGRLGYVLFYNFSEYLANPWKILKVWDGGMSSHGGMIAVIVAVGVFAAVNRINGVRLLDYVAVASPVGLGLGRLANFVNGELWGRPTGSDWGVIFPDAGPEPRYPSQLFEAGLEGLLLFAVLAFLFWRTDARLRPGVLAGVFGIGYSICRIIVENYREPDRQLGFLSTGLTMGQTLSLPVFIAGAGLLAYGLARRPVALPAA